MKLNHALQQSGQGGAGTPVLPPPTPPSPLESKCLSLFTLMAWLEFWEQSPLELAVSLRTQEKESKGEPGTKTPV